MSYFQDVMNQFSGGQQGVPQVPQFNNPIDSSVSAGHPGSPRQKGPLEQMVRGKLYGAGMDQAEKQVKTIWDSVGTPAQQTVATEAMQNAGVDAAINGAIPYVGIAKSLLSNNPMSGLASTAAGAAGTALGGPIGGMVASTLANSLMGGKPQQATPGTTNEGTTVGQQQDQTVSPLGGTLNPNDEEYQRYWQQMMNGGY